MNLTTTPSCLTTTSVAGSPDRRALWRLALGQRSVGMRVVQLELSVGVLQAAINQGDHWVSGAVNRAVVMKSIVSPLMGFTLVLVSAAQTWVQRSIEQSKS